MNTIKPYKAKSQNEENSPRGSINNPYTVAEFDSMCDNGTWTGGYVEGMGYCLPNVNVDSSMPGSDSSDDSGSWDDSDPFGSDISNPWDEPEDGPDDPNSQPNGGGNGSGGNNGSGEGNGSGLPEEHSGGYTPPANPKTRLASIAKKYVGYSESKNPAQILKWLRDAGIPNPTIKTAWCASFAYGMFKEAGLKGYKSAAVSGWKTNWGTYVDTPQVGDAAFWKEESHMGIVTAVNGDKVTVIHGNWSNAVYEFQDIPISEYIYKRGN